MYELDYLESIKYATMIFEAEYAKFKQVFESFKTESSDGVALFLQYMRFDTVSDYLDKELAMKCIEVPADLEEMKAIPWSKAAHNEKTKETLVDECVHRLDVLFKYLHNAIDENNAGLLCSVGMYLSILRRHISHPVLDLKDY